MALEAADRAASPLPAAVEAPDEAFLLGPGRLVGHSLYRSALLVRSKRHYLREHVSPSLELGGVLRERGHLSVVLGGEGVPPSTRLEG